MDPIILPGTDYYGAICSLLIYPDTVQLSALIDLHLYVKRVC